MVKEIPYNFGDTGINGEVLGRQNVYSLPLGNSVLTSEPLTITINKTPNSASSTYLLSYENLELGPTTDNNSINRNEIVQLSVNDTLFGIGSISSTPLIINTSNTSSLSKIYFLPYENPELGSNTDNNSINRNEIVQLSVNDTLFSSGIVSSTPLIISTVNTSSLFKTYFLSYDNPELGSNTDKTGVYRNQILQINNQRQYRYLIQDGTGSNYPVDPTRDSNYNNTKVVLNFDSLSNQAFTNLSLLSSGSFTINTGPTVNTSSFISNSIQVLVVAGGGGGGMDMGGGGGAGGVIYNNSYTITSGSVINVTVGNGGSGAPAAGTSGQPGGHQYTISATQGGNSVFGSITAIGGGYGGSSYFQYGPNNGYGGSGGSGGGASGYSDGNTGRNGTGSSGQGFNGGGSSGQYYSGGGGGAGGAGSSGPNIPNGGPGLQFYAMSPYYFGGGGGGSAYSVSPGGNGGIGGGGGGAVGTTTGGAGLNNGSPGGGGSINSWTNTPGGNAGANTGGGGGGGSHYNSNNKGGNGGSGIVIVRYYGSQKATGGTVTTVNGNTIHTLTGSATMSFYDNPSTDPVVGGYGYFDGSGSYVRISGSSLLNLGSGSVFESPFTVEYDFYTNSSSKYQTILSRGAGSINYNTSSGLVYNAGISSSKIIWEYYTNNTSSYLLTGSTNIIDNYWYSYAVTYDGNITRLYLNGVLENSISNSIYNYPSTLLPSLTSSFIGRLVNTSSNDFSGYLDKFRITTGIARYTNASYITQSSSYPTSTGFLAGSNYCNSNILNIRFANDYLTGSNLILPSGTNDFTSSQDILVTNITGTVNNNTINTISSGSNIIKRNDGITDKTIYTGDNYISDTTIFTRGNVERTTVESSQVIFNSLSDPSKNYSYKGTGSNIIIRNDGITDKTVYTGDNYVSDATIFTRGNVERTTIESSQVIFNSLSDPSKNYSYKGTGSNIIKRNDGISDKTIYTGDNYVSSATINAIGTIDKTILNGSSVVINTDTNNFIPSINKTFTYEVDYNAVFNQEIDSVLTIVTTYSLPLGFSISSDAKRISGYVNFTDTKTIKLELSDSSTYNIVLKPIFFKKKYTY